MKCPTCTETDLVMSERQGVEIDYCPKCRGVWLDRGELDKIIERSSSSPAARAEVEPPRSSLPPSGYPSEDRQFDDDDRGQYRGRQRKGSWLTELFD
ncbi:MAG: zf-TFIIB domain-containing protein [Verrucomicrobiota bacterium]